MKYLIVLVAILFASCDIMEMDLYLSTADQAVLSKVFPTDFVSNTVMGYTKKTEHYDTIMDIVYLHDDSQILVVAHELAHRWQFKQLGRVWKEDHNYKLPLGTLSNLGLEQEAQVVAILCGLRNGNSVYTQGSTYTMNDYDRLNVYATKYMEIGD